MLQLILLLNIYVMHQNNYLFNEKIGSHSGRVTKRSMEY